MAPPRKGSMNTRAYLNKEENNQAKSNNMIVVQMEQLIKIIQGHKEKNNATLGMATKMKKMFDEKLQSLEKENNLLKEQIIKKDKTENIRSEETLANKDKNNKEGKKHRTNEEETKSTGDSTESCSRIVNSKKTKRRPEKSFQKIERKKKVVNSGELSERLIEEVAKRIGRGLTYSLADRALKAMKGTSR